MNRQDAELYAGLVDSIAYLEQSRRSKRRQLLADLIPALEQQASTFQEQNRQQSSAINVFRFFSPGETTHSRLLAFFLDPRSHHGQGTLFLEEFLRLLHIKDSTPLAAHQWVVTAEIGRIDVLLRRAHPHSVIIIENKSNFAVDQPNQLYRYWYQEIYQKQLQQHRPVEELSRPPADQYRLLYLAPADWKVWEEQSLHKPTEWKEWGAHLPERVPIQPEQYLFRNLIVPWLENALLRLPATNHRLREFTLQYLQFWQTT